MAQNGPGPQHHHAQGAGAGAGGYHAQHQPHMHNGEVMQRQPNTQPRKGRFTEKTTLLSSDDEFQ